MYQLIIKTSTCWEAIKGNAFFATYSEASEQANTVWKNYETVIIKHEIVKG